MDPSMLQSPRIEQFLDVCLLPEHALATRLPTPVLVLEMTPHALQKRAGGFETSALSTDSIRALWTHLSALQKEGKRMKNDGLVRFVFPLKKREGSAFVNRITVGRTQSSDICLPDERISKLHAYFEQDERGGYTVTDAGSRNRTRVNDIEISPREKMRVISGDRVSFGQYVLAFLDPLEFRRYVSKLVESTKLGTTPMRS